MNCPHSYRVELELDLLQEGEPTLEDWREYERWMDGELSPREEENFDKLNAVLGSVPRSESREAYLSL